MADIVLDKLAKRYPNGFEAVKELSLEIAEAELLVLVGPSGCGKTTALRMIAGLEDISSGDLYIGGKRVNDVLERDRDIAMVFQNYALYPHMTVAQNIAFSLRLAKRPKQEIRERVHETAQLLGLEELLDRRPKQLSGGQRQRVAMGRAIIRKPQVFLMDEPLSNLDAQLRVHMRGEIEALQKRLGVTMVYVTHDQIEAMTMGDRVAVLRSGELQQVDTPTNVYDRPVNLFVAGFIGSPPMNLARATIDQADGSLVVHMGSAVIPIPAGLVRERKLDAWAGREVIVGIRPEDLEGPREDGSSQDGMKLEATIDRVEALGANMLGFFTVDAAPATSEAIAEATGGGLEEVALITREGTPFCATFEPRAFIRPGDRVEVTVDVRHLHFFDPESENAVGA
ncbi:MAG TPA: sn-glycerol-3-phosphate ABC transporter ATP-binding protein UgpC [Gaiellaceae bacterium]|jgi:multiple sugar transport system ATP-binding protein|nr:sn-glycerol-3-phosphate ABC transporter ATP-binding protein UgpC [Gaiellaceae bacterium]